MNPSNGIIGDNDSDSFSSVLALTETKVDSDQLMAEKQAARFSKTKEYKRLKAHLESRIEFYQKNLPGGIPIEEASAEHLGAMWVANKTIIDELNAIIDAYENARQAVAEDKSA